MAYEVKMPQLGLTMETGTIGEWLKAEGDTIAVGDPLVQVETDKLTNDVESETSGVLLKIVAAPGERIRVSPLARKTAKKLGVDYTGLMGSGPGGRIVQKDILAAELVSGVTGLMKANKIKVVNGTASFAGAKRLNIDQEGKAFQEDFDRIIIAAGSVPAVPPIPGLKDNLLCIDSTGALSLEKIPKRLLVIGGGVIGVELASVYHTFGTEVQIVEALPTILPNMDGELALMLRKRMEKQGIRILTGSKVLSVENKGDTTVVEVEAGGKKQKLETDLVLVAVGRRASTESLNLDKAGIKSERGKILADDHLRTNVPGVYAIGDCLGQVMLAHTASAQGEIAAENAMGHEAVREAVMAAEKRAVHIPNK